MQIEDGYRHNTVVVLQNTISRDPYGDRIHLVKCDCGTTKRVYGSLFRRPKAFQSCTCLRKTNKQIEVGDRFGSITIVETRVATSIGHIKHLGKCDCGTVKEFNDGSLKKGTSKSCGCSKRKHMLSDSHIYRVWSSMISRCRNPNHHAFHRYGARGIDVCERWLDFKNFLVDMGEKPPRASLERINNNLGYLPDNCCWTSMKNQGRNKERTTRYKYKGHEIPVSFLADVAPVGLTTLHKRLRKYGDVTKGKIEITENVLEAALDAYRKRFATGVIEDYLEERDEDAD